MPLTSYLKDQIDVSLWLCSKKITTKYSIYDLKKEQQTIIDIFNVDISKYFVFPKAKWLNNVLKLENK